MKATLIALAQTLVLLLLLNGCAAPHNNLSHSVPSVPQKPPDVADAREARIQRDTAQLRDQNSELEDLRSKVKLREEQLGSMFKLLQINDRISEKKKEMIQTMQKDFEPQKDALFKAVGGNGHLLKFEAEDIIVYKASVVMMVLFLWENDDGSGGLGRTAIALDPEKNCEVSGYAMSDQVLISRQELAALLHGNGAQVEQAASRLEAQPPPAAEFKLSDETKNTLIQSGIIIGAGILSKLLSDN